MKSMTMSMKWVAWLLLGLGALFVAVGVLIGTFVTGFVTEAEEQAFRIIFPSVFGGLGVIMAGIGIAVWVGIRQKDTLRESLMAGGKFGWAEVVDITPNYNISVSGRAPFVLRCTLAHSDGQTYLLKSRYLRYNPSALLPEGRVKVWFDPYDIKRYVVDVEGSLKDRIIEV